MEITGNIFCLVIVFWLEFLLTNDNSDAHSSCNGFDCNDSICFIEHGIATCCCSNGDKIDTENGKNCGDDEDFDPKIPIGNAKIPILVATVQRVIMMKMIDIGMPAKKTWMVKRMSQY